MRRSALGVLLLLISSLFSQESLAQSRSGATSQPSTPPADSHQHRQATLPAAAECGAGFDASHSRDGSGTAWLPDATPMYGRSWCAGAWELMAHGSAFVQFVDERGPRGSEQFGSVNWMMGSASRRLGRGRVRLRGMLSVEPWTIRGCGYPNLLASGELCADQPIYDLQHPHDLLMEVAAEYHWPVAETLGLQLYGGLAGEPALGPVAYPHRVSALPNPIAPMSHHWLDATHVTFGVVTAAMHGRAWKVEASLFNGREPDEHRHDVDLGALDSWSGRVSWLPARSVALQVSAGHLEEAEAQSLHDGGARFDVDRMTASATYHRLWGADSVWATMVAWGRNVEVVGRTNAFLIESNLTAGDRDSWFGRYEIVSKPAYDLGIFTPGACATAHCPPDSSAGVLDAIALVLPQTPCCAPEDDPATAIYTVSKIQLGYVRYLKRWRWLRPGFGATASLSIVPASIESYYGGRTTPGLGFFVTVRPSGRPSGHTMPHAPFGRKPSRS